MGLTTLPALAQDDAGKKEAKVRFQEGTALMAAGNYEQARAKFVQSYAAGIAPNVVFNLARCDHLTGRHLDAARHYREYLRIADPKKVTAKERADVDGWIHDVLPFLARIEVAAPAGAHVFVDGTLVGDAPLAEPLEMAKGRHALVAEANGKKLTADVDAPAGAITRVSLLEEPGVSAPAVAPLKDPPITEPPPIGDASGSFWGARSIAGLAFVGAGAVGLGFGLAFNGQKSSQQSKMDDLQGSLPAGEPGARCFNATSSACTDLKDARSARDAGGDRATVAFSLGIGGVVVGAGLLASAAIWPHRKSSSAASTHPRLIPVGSASGGGLLFLSNF